MGVALDELIVRADSAVAGLGHAPSTLWQYRWAWARFRVFWGCPRLVDILMVGFAPADEDGMHGCEEEVVYPEVPQGGGAVGD